MKQYLELVDTQGRDVFIAAEDISVIMNAGNKTSTIVCQGVATSITVAKSHFEIIKMMAEIKALDLVKFP